MKNSPQGWIQGGYRDPCPLPLFWSEPTQIMVGCWMLSAHRHSADVYQDIKYSTPQPSRNGLWELPRDSAVGVPWIHWGLVQKENGGLCEHTLSTPAKYLIGSWMPMKSNM